PGGEDNQAIGKASFAAGERARANHDHTFVWGDSPSPAYASTGTNQFLIHASGGVGIGHNNPRHNLHVGITLGTNSINNSTNVIAVENSGDNGRATFLALAGNGAATSTNRVELFLEADEGQRR